MVGSRNAVRLFLRIAEETPGIAAWEYRWRHGGGLVPQMVLTQFDARKASLR